MKKYFETVDGSSLAAFRILVGSIFFLSTVRFIAKGWIDSLYLKPTFFFTFYGFEWVQPWPAWGLYLHFMIMALAALMITVGLFYRLAAVIFFLTFTYVELIDKTPYLNHYYLISLLSFLFIFLPLHHRYSFDVWRKPSLKTKPCYVWNLLILRFQLVVVYFFAGLAKLNADWLLNAQPIKLWLASKNNMPLIGSFLTESWAAYCLSWCGALFDLTIPVWLSWKRSRLWAYFTVCVFHGLTALLFPPIGIFPWLMIVATPIFFAPDWPNLFFRSTTSDVIEVNDSLKRIAQRNPRRLRRGKLANRDIISMFFEDSPRLAAGSFNPFSPDKAGGVFRKRKITLALIIIYAVLQILIPLRHLLYPGPVHWTEEGFRFSWKVMIIEKNGSAEFEIVDPVTSQRWWVNPREFLTPFQTKMMSTQPDMILQFAHWIGIHFKNRLGYVPKVYAHVFVSLNGRPNRRLIDEKRNLMEVQEGWAVKDWLLKPE